MDAVYQRGGISVTLCEPLSNSELAYLDGILVASAIVVDVVEGEINCRLRTGDDLPDGGEASSSSESDISASSEGSAVQPDERDWPAAGRPGNRRSCIKPGMFTGERLKRAAQPSAVASEEAGGLDN